MLSRTTARAIAEVFTMSFRKFGSEGSLYSWWESEAVGIYDFLYDHSYPAWFCNIARKTAPAYHTTRPFQDFILKLHTGEAVVTATPDWTWEQRERLGQQLLRDLAQDLIGHWNGRQRGYSDREIDGILDRLRAGLELDGYQFREGKLLAPESDVLDAREQGGVLQTLYTELNLPDSETVFHHLALSEEHYLAKRWDDSISNSRKFLEAVLEAVAAAFSSQKESATLDASVVGKPVRVREYLERAGLLERKEKEAIASIYGLLSETGGHPYMAGSEQARLLRHLALTLSQFIMLRLRGALSKAA